LPVVALHAAPFGVKQVHAAWHVVTPTFFGIMTNLFVALVAVQLF
jgi:hypothetical protein